MIQKLLDDFMDPYPIAFRFEAVPLSGEASRRQREIQMKNHLKKEIENELIQKGLLPSEIQTSLSHAYFGRGRQVEDGGHRIIILGSSIRVGIDLEHADRGLSVRLANRLLSKSEWDFGLLPVEFWVIKESLFKSNPENKKTFLSQYQVVSWNAGQNQGFARWESQKFKFMLIRSGSWVFAVARQE